MSFEQQMQQAMRSFIVEAQELLEGMERGLMELDQPQGDPAAQDDDGWDALVFLADGGHPVDPQVTDLFLSCGCRTNLDGCTCIGELDRVRLDQILKEHAEWKEKQDHLLAENSQADSAVNWSR